MFMFIVNDTSLFTACSCTYNGNRYPTGSTIYNTTDGHGNCMTAVCGKNGTIEKSSYNCPVSTPVTQKPTETTPATTFVFTSTTPGIYKILQHFKMSTGYVLSNTGLIVSPQSLLQLHAVLVNGHHGMIPASPHWELQEETVKPTIRLEKQVTKYVINQVRFNAELRNSPTSRLAKSDK